MGEGTSLVWKISFVAGENEDSVQLEALVGENQGSKVFRHMVRVTIHDTGWLLAHEVTLRISAEPLDAI